MKWLSKMLVRLCSANAHLRAFLVWARYVPVTEHPGWSKENAARLKEFLTGDETGRKFRDLLLYECHAYDRSAPQNHSVKVAAGFCLGARALRSKIESWMEYDAGEPPQPAARQAGNTQGSGGADEESAPGAGETLRGMLQPT